MMLLCSFLLIIHTAFSIPTVEEDAMINDANIEILKDERSFGGDGSYTFNFETENGIIRSEKGTVREPGGPVVSEGEISYRLPNGELFHLTFIADENGYQPKSNFLPVAPIFPHPIPDFVQKQIEKAKREDEEMERILEEKKMTIKDEKEELREPEMVGKSFENEQNPLQSDITKESKDDKNNEETELQASKLASLFTLPDIEEETETTTVTPGSFGIVELIDRTLQHFLNRGKEKKDKQTTFTLQETNTED